jgi:hypothetical protein
MTDALRIGWTQAEAASRRRTYRCLLLIVLIVQAVAAVLALAAPVWLAQSLHLPEPFPDAWLRIVGAFLLITTLLYVPGYINPVFARFPNVVGIAARFGLAILYLCLGGNFRWLAAYELIVALALGVTYQRLIGAELMSRP